MFRFENTSCTHRPDGAHAVEDLAEDDVLAVEPGSLDGGDEELQEFRVAKLAH